jgi:hypothetical protein
LLHFTGRCSANSTHNRAGSVRKKARSSRVAFPDAESSAGFPPAVWRRLFLSGSVPASLCLRSPYPLKGVVSLIKIGMDVEQSVIGVPISHAA